MKASEDRDFADLQSVAILKIKKSDRARLSLVILSLILINLLFGSALTRFNLSQLLPKQTQYTPGVESPNTPGVEKTIGSTQLESGGTESGTIRLIVWQGALEIFKHYPIFGSGVETFAYSYYQFRPIAHNLVSEWDFLYNKAHNEFLNYLATTGILGFGTYCILIITFIIFILRKPNLLTISILASYVSYLVQNFFGFSVVIIAIFFFLFPAIAFVASDSTKPLILNSKFSILNLLYRRSIYLKATQIFIILSIFYFLSSIFKLWYADTLFAKGERQNELGNPGAAYNFLSDAVSLNKKEPFYKSELGYAAGAAALALKDTEESTRSAQLKDESIALTKEVLAKHPKNVSFWRTAVRTYFELSGLDEKYTQITLDTIDKTISLAPTDPKLLYNKAVILGEVEKGEEAVKTLQKAIELKPNYVDAYYALSLFQFDGKQAELAVKTMNKVLEISPANPEALDKLNEWGETGIATKSGTNN